MRVEESHTVHTYQGLLVGMGEGMQLYDATPFQVKGGVSVSIHMVCHSVELRSLNGQCTLLLSQLHAGAGF